MQLQTTTFVTLAALSLGAPTATLKPSTTVNQPAKRLSRPRMPLSSRLPRKTDVKANEELEQFQSELEQKFVEKRIEMLEETMADKASQSPFGTVGGTAPMGEFWDPASFTKEADVNSVKRYREAELTHGRVAMLGALGFLLQESFHPLFGGKIDGPAVYHFQEISKVAPNFWYPVFLAIAVAEVGRARYGWEDPTSGSLFGLRDGYEPGNLGFDPLGLYPKANDKASVDMKNKELNNGRLAMLGLSGMIVQELLNGKPILENLSQ
uniref:Uncharacterized protein n=1 Tax=Lotharella globosa TaxID=91324 RepID=A0A6U3EZD6_9EUKA|mmetsp:Transcript_2569/g.5076  ORF Transcript_2569/g.5076 Transcript_2569/m.5076 type:complete len:266 (+) Transcript_2569:69-866(+)